MPRDTEGLTKRFEEEWVDIGRPKKKVNISLAVEKKHQPIKKVILNVYQNLKLQV